MPIPVTCSECSARLNAPDAAAGKSLKCPKCGAKIVVPSALSSEDEPPTPPKPKGPPAPKKASKPDVNLEDEEDFDDEPKPKTKKRPRDDEDFEDEDRPRKQKTAEKKPAKKSPLLLIGLIGVVLLFLCGGGVVGGYFLFFAEEKKVVENKGGDANKQPNPFKTTEPTKTSENTAKPTDPPIKTNPPINTNPPKIEPTKTAPPKTDPPKLPEKLPVDPDIQIINPLTSFTFEAGIKKGTKPPSISNFHFSADGKSLIVVYSGEDYQLKTDVWDVGATPKRRFSLNFVTTGVTKEIIEGWDRKTYQLSDGKPSTKPFLGARVYSGGAVDFGSLATENSSYRWSERNAFEGRKPYTISEDTKDKKTVIHTATDNEIITLGGLNSSNTHLVIGVRSQNKIALFEFAAKKVTREITLAEPRPLSTIIKSGVPDWDGFQIDPSLKWFGARRLFAGQGPDPYEIFDGDGAVVLKLNYDELSHQAQKFLPTRDRLVTGMTGLSKPFENTDLAILNLKTKQFDAILRGHKGFFDKIVVSPDGSLVATINNKDLTISIWDVSKLK